MRKGIITLFILFQCFLFVPITGCSSADSENLTDENNTSQVYICNSSGTYVYHNSESCRGLGRCTHEVLTISMSEAKSRGRRACKICY